MVTEHALLSVVAGQEQDFERAFRKARTVISSVSGFQGLSLSRSLETPGLYLLLVEWDRLEDHTIGFRQSREYQEWSRLLHRFYDPFPIVEHYKAVQLVAS